MQKLVLGIPYISFTEYFLLIYPRELNFIRKFSHLHFFEL